MSVVIGIFVFAFCLYVLSIAGHMTGLIIDTSVLVLVICLVRALFRRRIHAGVMYSLWGLVALRFFAAPVLALFGRLGYFQELFGMGAVNPLNAGVDAIRGWTGTAPAQMVGNMPARADLLAVSLPAWFWPMWLAGVLCFYLWSVYVNEKFRRQLFDNRIRIPVPECRYPVYKVPGILSPCVMRVNGKVGIYLTETAADKEERREYVLAHELCHLRHRDLFWGNVRLIILACNWFNPLIWLAAVLSKRDEEIACDERVIGVLGEAKRLRYGKVLVDVVAGAVIRKNIVITATTMSCRKKELVQRVWRIASGKKHAAFSGAVFVLAIVTAFMTSFVARADMKGLSPEETARQYVYYREQNYKEGMAALSISGSGYRKQDGSVPRKCGNIDPGDGYYEIEEGDFAEACRLKMDVWETVSEPDPEGRSQTTQVKTQEEFLLVREEEGADWKVLLILEEMPDPLFPF